MCPEWSVIIWASAQEPSTVIHELNYTVLVYEFELPKCDINSAISVEL
jgi:hypothetical protein